MVSRSGKDKESSFGGVACTSFRRSRGKKIAKRGPQPARTKNKKDTAPLKSKVRGLQRLLQHAGSKMSSAARSKMEAEICSLKALAEDRKRRERERNFAKKYHMVKFFERRKIQRKLEIVERRMAQHGADAENLLVQKRKLEEDLCYVLNFPKDQPYLSLYPTSGHDESARETVRRLREQILSSYGNMQMQVLPRE